MGSRVRSFRTSQTGRRRHQVESFDPRRLSLPWLRGRGNVQDLARGSYQTRQQLCQPRNGEQLGKHLDTLSTMPQAQACEGTMSTESSGKPDAWKLARPVWGWGRGETPRPTPRAFEVFGQSSQDRKAQKTLLAMSRDRGCLVSHCA